MRHVVVVVRGALNESHAVCKEIEHSSSVLHSGYDNCSPRLCRSSERLLHWHPRLRVKPRPEHASIQAVDVARSMVVIFIITCSVLSTFDVLG